eukprot:UN00136
MILFSKNSFSFISIRDFDGKVCLNQNVNTRHKTQQNVTIKSRSNIRFCQ